MKWIKSFRSNAVFKHIETPGCQEIPHINNKKSVEIDQACCRFMCKKTKLLLNLTTYANAVRYFCFLKGLVGEDINQWNVSSSGKPPPKRAVYILQKEIIFRLFVRTSEQCLLQEKIKEAGCCSDCNSTAPNSLIVISTGGYISCTCGLQEKIRGAGCCADCNSSAQQFDRFLL